MMQVNMKGLVDQVFRAPSYTVALKRGCDLIMARQGGTSLGLLPVFVAMASLAEAAAGAAA